MQLLYNGKDITDSVDIREAEISDCAGGMADSIDLIFNDTKGLWSKWKPQKNDTIQLFDSGFNSGMMYIDEIGQKRGAFIIRALSIPQESKTQHTKSWEKIRFIELASEISKKYGFGLQMYGINDYIYDRVDQVDKADFFFLDIRCMLEGYILKVTNKNAVIYSENYMESQDPVEIISSDEIDGDFDFWDISTDTFSSCFIQYGKIKFNFIPSVHFPGPVLKIKDMYLSNLAEAERFSKNMLRSKNKSTAKGTFMKDYVPGLAAGNMIYINNFGYFDGKYFVDQVKHRMVSKKTILKVRKPLEGY